MKLISEVVGTCSSSMAVVDCEERASWPLIYILKLWLDDIQDNGNSIFIVVSDDSLVSVCTITAHDSIFLTSKLGWVVRGDVPFDLLMLHFDVLLLLLVGHNEATICHKRVGRLTLR